MTPSFKMLSNCFICFFLIMVLALELPSGAETDKTKQIIHHSLITLSPRDFSSFSSTESLNEPKQLNLELCTCTIFVQISI